MTEKSNSTSNTNIEEKHTNKNWVNWALLLTVALIWGSSFILMKRGIEVFTPMQVATLRIALSALVLLPFTFREIKKLRKKDWWIFVIVGWIGTTIPAFLFPLAQTQIASSLAAMLNTLVPLNTFVIGLLFFGVVFKWNKLAGALLGLLGALFLIFVQNSGDIALNSYGLLIIVSGTMYAISMNTIKRYAQNINPFGLTLAAFWTCAPFAIVLLFSGDFLERLTQIGPNGSHEGYAAFGYIFILAAFGTALANTLFFFLVQRTSPLFASSVTYLIPFVALLWGVLDGEIIGWSHIVGFGLILSGVYLVSKN